MNLTSVNDGIRIIYSHGAMSRTEKPSCLVFQVHQASVSYVGPLTYKLGTYNVGSHALDERRDVCEFPSLI